MNTDDHPEGFYVTDIELEILSSEEIGYVARCVFPYRVQLKGNDGSAISQEQRCLRTEPTWMQDNRDAIGSRQIGSLMLVVAHDAGAFQQYQGSGDQNFASSLVYAQEEDLQVQLQYGVRYLDIRVGYCE